MASINTGELDGEIWYCIFSSFLSLPNYSLQVWERTVFINTSFYTKISGSGDMGLVTVCLSHPSLTTSPNLLTSSPPHLLSFFSPSYIIRMVAFDHPAKSMQSSPFEARYQQLISDLAVGHPFVISSSISVLTFDRFECEVMGPKYLPFFSFDSCFLFLYFFLYLMIGSST